MRVIISMLCRTASLALAAGWAQIVALGAFCKTSQDTWRLLRDERLHDQSLGSAAAAADFSFQMLTSSDSAQETTSLLRRSLMTASP